jgi:hypothetical protein
VNEANEGPKALDIPLRGIAWNRNRDRKESGMVFFAFSISLDKSASAADNEGSSASPYSKSWQARW